MVPYAETPRLILRPLTKTDLPRMVDLIGDWDVVRWLVSVPYPYGLKDAEEFYSQMCRAHENGSPELFVIQPKSGEGLIGAVGLHPPRDAKQPSDELIFGYWLGRDYWKQGYATEASSAVIKLAFDRSSTAHITATTDPANEASQNVLRKSGLHFVGIVPHEDRDFFGTVLRGSKEVTRWKLTREDYEKRKQAA